MARKLNMVVLMTLVIATMLHSSLAQTTHEVGGAMGWIVPPGGEVAYRTWAATQTFTVGDVLVFNFTTGSHDVAEVSKASYDSCNATTTISMSATGPTSITLTSAGEHLFICTFARHCGLGQKLAINVSAASSAPPPQSTTPPPAGTPVPTPTPTPAPSTYTVGDALGWTVPPGGSIAYQTWARGKSFLVGDILVFNFTTGAHDVAEVTKAEYDSCTVSPSTTLITTGPARITLSAAGEHYYICTIGQHCSLGQKIAINVTGGGSTVTPPSSPAPGPSSGTPPPSSSATPPPSPGSSTSPSTPSTPPPVTNTPSPPPPPPSNSAPSFAVAAALPFTFLAVALAFLYN